MAGLSRSSRSASLAVLAGAEHSSTPEGPGRGLGLGPSSPPALVSHNSGFVVTSRRKEYTPPGSSPELPPSPQMALTAAAAAAAAPRAPMPPPLAHHASTSSKGSRASSPPSLFRQRLGHEPSGSSTASSPPLASEPKTTLHLSSSIDSKGRRMVNQYVRLKTIGTGTYGKVWLCAEPNPREDDADADAESGAVPGPGPRSTQELHRWEEETESEGVKYCAIKSVAREGPGRGKSLRVAKGRKAAAASGSTGGIGADDKVKREVAIMKRLDHKNVVRLKEVIDDVKSKKVFMVLEFMAGGQIVWQDDEKRPTMTVDEARRTFRDVVLGLEYLHYQGIIHRDIKPANLLWTEDHSTVKISDFGVSHVSEALLRASPDANGTEGDDDKALRKTAGSPAFFAPELCHPAEYTPTPRAERVEHAEDGYFAHGDAHSASRVSSPGGSTSSGTPTARRTSTIISPPLPAPDPNQPRTRPTIGKGIDVWALGVTLFCLLFGDTPFMARTEYELYNVIVREGVPVPDRMGKEGAWTGVGQGWEGCGDGVEGREVVDLLARLLQKDPTKRIGLAEVKKHPWVLRNLASSPDSWLCDTDPAQSDTVFVTEEDVQQATQERGAADTLPPIRQRPGIRRALNAALIRFPAFRLKGSRHAQNGGRSRSKSASSTSASAADGTSEAPSSEHPSRHPSDATSNSRKKTSGEFGVDIRRIISGGRDHSPPHSAHVSGTSTPVTNIGGSRNGWGSRLVSRDKQDVPAFPPLARSVSASSVAVNGSRSRPFLSSSSGHPSVRPESTSRTPSGGSVSRPTSTSRPGSPGQFAASDNESTGRRRLTNVFSRLGGRKTPRLVERQSSLSDDESHSVADLETVDDRRGGTRSALDIFAPGGTEFVNGSEYTVTDFDEVVDTSDYSSEEDDDDDDAYGHELAGPPLSQLDGISGWQNDFATFAVGGDGFGSPGLVDDSKKAPSTYTLCDDSTPRASAHLTLTGLDPDPSATPPPLVRQASDTPTKRPVAIRDGSFRSNPPDATVAPRKWHVYPDEGTAPPPSEPEYDEDEEEETDLFVAPRRRRAQTLAHE